MNKFISSILLLCFFCIHECYASSPCYEVIEVPVVCAENYEQIAASYSELAAAYDRLSYEYSNNWGNFRVGADYLYWHADNDALDYAITGVGTNAPGQVFSVNGGWKSGYRILAGYSFPCDNWFLNFCWTHYHTNASRTTRPTPGLTLYSTRGNPAGTFATITNRATANWDLCIDSFKWDFTYLFWTRFNLGFKPCIGLRWDRIKDKFDITYLVTTTPTTEFIRIHQDIHAIGPTVGLGSEWNFYRNLSFFGDFQWAVLWSKYRVTQVVDVVQAAITSDINTSKKRHIAKQNLDLLVGIKWESHFNARSGLIVKLGWENLLWVDYGETFYFVDTVADGRIVPATNDLTVSGLTLRIEAFF